MKNRTVSEDFNFNYLVEKTDGYSGAEVMFSSFSNLLYFIHKNL